MADLPAIRLVPCPWIGQHGPCSAEPGEGCRFGDETIARTLVYVHEARRAAYAATHPRILLAAIRVEEGRLVRAVAATEEALREEEGATDRDELTVERMRADMQALRAELAELREAMKVI